MSQKKLVAIALGSNLGDRKDNILTAANRLTEEFVEELKLSPLLETEPWGILDQPKFINAVAVGKCDWKPPAIISYLKSLERELGRRETVKNGPRLIDLDLLLWGDDLWKSDGVEVPHPGLANRDFVLLPLVELLPHWVHPSLKQSITELAEKVRQKR